MTLRTCLLYLSLLQRRSWYHLCDQTHATRTRAQMDPIKGWKGRICTDDRRREQCEHVGREVQLLCLLHLLEIELRYWYFLGTVESGSQYFVFPLPTFSLRICNSVRTAKSNLNLFYPQEQLRCRIETHKSTAKLDKANKCSRKVTSLSSLFILFRPFYSFTFTLTTISPVFFHYFNST